jgi:thiosulfate/3-mercaptopyruvate sulfurtransferase
MSALPVLLAPADLAARLQDPALRVVDATAVLRFPPEGGPPQVTSGRPGYEAGHVPGAVFADLIADLSDPDVALPFALPSAERFAAGASRLGIGPGTQVVVYDQGPTVWATRLWWLLRVFGHDEVGVLDGGLPAWQAEGHPVSTGPVAVAPTAFRATLRRDLLATGDDVMAAVEQGGTCIVNALSSEAFRGEGPQSLPRPGRIPGSVSLPAGGLTDPGTGRLRPLEELRAAVAAAGADGPGAPIAYCGGGIAATLDAFAFAVLGRTDAKVYDGSLSEWASDPSRPLVTG